MKGERLGCSAGHARAERSTRHAAERAASRAAGRAWRKAASTANLRLSLSGACVDEARVILQALYATRSQSAADRKKIDRLWADYEMQRARGHKGHFGELVVRRGIMTGVELKHLLAGERKALGSDAAVHAASGAGPTPLGQRGFNVRVALTFLGVAALLSAAFVVNVTGPKASEGPTTAIDDPATVEARRQDSFGQHLEAAARERVAGNDAEARRELDRAAGVASTQEEKDRVEAERGRLPVPEKGDGGAAEAIARAKALEAAGKLDEAEALLRHWVNAHINDDLPEEKDVRAALAEARVKLKEATTAAAMRPGTPTAEPAHPGDDDPLAVEDKAPKQDPNHPTPPRAEPPPEPEAEPSGPPLSTDEQLAAAFASDELVKLAQFCARNQAFREARAELDNALAILPGAEAPRAELAKLGDPSSEPTRFFRDNFERERRNAHMRAANRLADVALQLRQGGDREKHDRWVEVIQQCFSGETTEKALSRIGLAYFAPYLQWVDAADARRLEDGQEEMDGKWLDREGVAEVNLQHSTWDTPWVLTDEAHELRTNLTLRNARRMLYQVGAFRKFFLKTFSKQWRLRQPLTKLPIILTKTREDYLSQLAAEGLRRGITIPEPHGAAAFYIRLMPVGPIFVTIEPAMMDGSTMKSSYDLLVQILKHELTHQIAREYSAFDCINPSVPEQFWCVEGLAECLAFYTNDRGHWHLNHPAKIASREAGVYFVSAWGYVARNLDSLPKLETFFGYDQAKDYQAAGSCYPQGASVVDFMLHGEHGRYRRSFVRLCEAVHKGKITPLTFEECFPGIDRQRLQRQWLRFVRSFPLDDE